MGVLVGAFAPSAQIGSRTPGEPQQNCTNIQIGKEDHTKQEHGHQEKSIGSSASLPHQRREVIWKGELEWQEKGKDGPGDQKISHSVACSVSTSRENGAPEVKSDNWPPRLIMQLIPKTLVQALGMEYFRNSKSV